MEIDINVQIAGRQHRVCIESDTLDTGAVVMLATGTLNTLLRQIEEVKSPAQEYALTLDDPERADAAVTKSYVEQNHH